MTVSPASLTFSTTNWESEQEVTVTGVDDADGSDESVAVSHAGSGGGYDDTWSYQVRVADDEAANVVAPANFTADSGRVASYTVRLSQKPAGEVTVAVTLGADTPATLGTSELTFTATDWSSPQRVTLTADVVETAYDTGTITHKASGARAYAGRSASTALRVEGSDVGRLAIDPDGVIVLEGGSEVSYGVSLQLEPTADVTVAVTSLDTGAATVAPASLTFTPDNWDTEQDVTVTGVEDVDPLNELVSILHVASGTSAYEGVQREAVARVRDDEELQLVMPGGHRIVEGESLEYAVQLSQAPQASVTVSLTSSDTSVVTVTTAESDNNLTFSTTNWDTGQTVTLATTQDADGQDDTATVTHEVTGSDEYVYASFTANVRVLEDDVGKIDIQPAGGITLGEGGDDVSYSVKLLQQPVTNVTVRVSVGTEVIIASTPKVSVDKSALTFTPRNWEHGAGAWR